MLEERLLVDRKSLGHIIIQETIVIVGCTTDKRSSKRWAIVQGGANEAMLWGNKDWIFNCKISISISSINMYICICIYVLF